MNRHEQDRLVAEAEAARSRNALLQRLARTPFRKGQVVLLDGRWRVEIVDVLPEGHVSAPLSIGRSGSWIGPVVNDCDLYRFKAVDAGAPPSGQTTVEHLSALSAA